MNELPDAIPVLDDLVEDDAAPQADEPRGRPLEDLEALLAISIHERADELVHNACRELEALLLEQVSDRLRAELPALISRVVAEYFEGPARPH